MTFFYMTLQSQGVKEHQTLTSGCRPWVDSLDQSSAFALLHSESDRAESRQTDEHNTGHLFIMIANSHILAKHHWFTSSETQRRLGTMGIYKQRLGLHLVLTCIFVIFKSTQFKEHVIWVFKKYLICCLKYFDLDYYNLFPEVV